jgi:arylsulfatase A-like enzyme
VGTGVVGEIATGYPGYDSIIPIDKGTIGTILKENGYSTSWFGKNHNTPSYRRSRAMHESGGLRLASIGQRRVLSCAICAGR